MTTPLRNSGPKPASGPPRPMTPAKEDDLKDYFSLVELLWKMSPRELKKAMVIRDGNILLEVVDDKTPEAKKIVDLVRLCRNIPGHLITCLIKEDPKFWVNDYLLHGIKLLFHLIRLGKKCHGDLEKQINRKVDLILDVCVFMLVVSLQSMSNTTDLRTGESCVNIIGTCYLMVDYVIDSEFDSKRQPFLDALIDHPKLETFITATFDAAKLVTKHRSTFSSKGEAYSALVTKCLSSIFDCMDTLCMAEEFVEKILDKTRWEDGSFLDTLTDVIKDYKFGAPVSNSCLKLIYRLCEEEQPPFLQMVASSPANSKFQQMISSLVELSSDCWSNKLKGYEDVKLESVKLLEILSDDQNYKQDIICKGTNLILKSLSRAPQQFADQFSNADRNAIIVLFKTVGNLHCRALAKDDEKNRFLNQVVDVAKHRGLFLKKFTSEERVYIPFVVQNLNFLIDSTLKNSKLHKEISKEDVELVFDFRKELERAIGLNLSPSDPEFEKKLLDWDSSHSSEVEDDSSRESKSKTLKSGLATAPSSTSSINNTKKRKREEEDEDDEDSGGKHSKKRRKKEEEDYEEAGTDDDKKPGRVGRPPKKKRGRKAGSVNRQRHTSIQKPTSGGCFDGLTFRLGKSVDRPDLIEKIVENGGVVLQYTTKHTTHYLATKDEYDEKGPQILAATKRPIFLVSEQFVHESVRGNKKVAEFTYLLDAKSAPAIKTNGEGFGAVKKIE